MAKADDPGQPRQEPTDAEVAAYVAETCADLARLSQRPGFQTVRYMLGLARVEAEKLVQGENRLKRLSSA